ncbi:MAG: ABC transporter permease [Candidatus Omnitrophica bacterium]|nr:ABC transporter permease [Candidatus Omnitrophota bacterium]
MKKIWILACNTVKESFRKKTTYIIVLFALIMIASSEFFAFLSSTEQYKMITDTSFAVIEFFGFLLAMFGSISAVSSEIEKRTIYTLLTKPITRTNFVLGKYLGMFFILLINFSIMAVFFVGLLHFKKIPMDSGTFKALFLIFVEILVIASISLSLATFTSDAFNIIASSFIYIIGHLTGYGRQIIGMTKNIAVKGLADMMYTILPNYQNFTIRDKVVVGIPIPWQYVIIVTGYGIMYIVIALLIGIYFFRTREI